MSDRQSLNLTAFRCGLDPKNEWVWGEGHPNAPVMLLGYMAPNEHERRPFTIEPMSRLRVMLHMLGVPPQAVYLNYLVKNGYREGEIDFWRDVLRDELAGHLHPRAIVLLGDIVGSYVLDPVSCSAEKYRLTRITHADFPGQNFFLTHSPESLHKPEFEQECAQDLLAVIETRHNYFKHNQSFGYAEG